jgi:hypothetical protein
MFENVARAISCPYCGEWVEVLVDTSVEYQEYVEDCSVCCCPMVLSVTVEGDDVSVLARDENDAFG